MSVSRQIIAERKPGTRRAGVLLLIAALAGGRGCSTGPRPPQEPDTARHAQAGNGSEGPRYHRSEFDRPADLSSSPLAEAIHPDMLSLTSSFERALHDRANLNWASSTLQSRFAESNWMRVDVVNDAPMVPDAAPKADPGEAGTESPSGGGGSGGSAAGSSSPTGSRGSGDAAQAPPAAANAPGAPPATRGGASPPPAKREDPQRAKLDDAEAVRQPGGPGVGRPVATGTAEERRERMEVPLKVGADEKDLDVLAAKPGADRGQVERPLARFDEELWVISRPAPHGAVPESRRPPDAGAGALWLGRGAEGRTATLVDYKAQATITGPIASVTVSQSFRNDLSETMDGVYVLPMPRDAAVTDFVMTVGAPGRERRIRGVIRERAEAERIFLDAQRQGKVASLLDEESANLLVQRIGNIESGASIATSVTYFGTLDYAVFPGPQGSKTGGAYEFTLPVAGLWRPEGPVPASVSVRIETGGEILAIVSPTHAVSIGAETEHGRTVTMGAPMHASSRDFVLRYAVAAPSPRVSVVTQCGAGGTYFSMLITPPDQTGERAPIELAIVADMSDRATPAEAQAIKAAVAMLLAKLKPTDRFAVSSSAFTSGELAPATPEAIAAALERTGTPIARDESRSLGQLLRQALAAGDGPPRMVCVVARGEISDSVQALREARANARASRIFAVSVDERAGFALESLSRIGRGGVVHLSSNPSAASINDSILGRLLDREGSPVMTDLEIDWGGAEVADVFPRRLPELSAGRPIHIVGRLLAEPPADRGIRVMGTVRGSSAPRRETIAARWNPTTPAAGAIPTLWARAKVLMLSEQLAAGPADADAIRRELVELALRHNLVSAMTSFISVDAMSSVTPTEPRVDQAANAPR